MMNFANQMETEENHSLLQTEEDNETTSFSHDDLLEITKTTLNEVIQRDSLLSDLPADVTVEEVNGQIALEHGQSMTVYVIRGNGEELPVVVSIYKLTDSFYLIIILYQFENYLKHEILQRPTFISVRPRPTV